MKTRFLALGLAAISAALVACGGGGGGGGSYTPPAPTSTPSTTPTPAPTYNPFGCVGQAPFIATAARRSMAAPRPIGSGDTFTYTGALQQTYAQSAPCPQPTATTSAQIATTVTDTATTAPGGGGATASTVDETDTFPTQTSSTTTTQVLQISGSKLLLYSTASSDGSGNSMTTAYNTPQEIDDLGGGGTWSNADPSGTVKEALADGSTVSRTIATDGSYAETQTYPNGTTASIGMNGAANGKTIDGSGVYTFAGAAFTYGAPAGGNITLTITAGGTSKTRTFPAWFTVPAAGGSYVTDTFADNGSKALDPSCSVAATIGATSGTQIVETYNVLDPVLGYTETRTTTSYDVAGYGPACVVISDTLNSYYDYSLDTTKLDYQSQNAKPNAVNTITETLSMQSAVCGSGTAPCAQLRRAASVQPVSPAEVAGRVAAIEHYRALERAQRLDAMRRFALHVLHQGAVR